MVFRIPIDLINLFSLKIQIFWLELEPFKIYIYENKTTLKINKHYLLSSVIRSNIDFVVEYINKKKITGNIKNLGHLEFLK